jgi:hypothetical protein
VTATPTLIRDLRLRGVRLAARGDRVHVEAPAGVVSQDARERLAAAKAEVLAQLTLEQRFVGMTCGQFARERFSVEIRLPDVDETLWLVPQPADAARLVSEGIARGRIFTAHELADLLSIPALRPDDFQKLVQLKTAFDADIVAVADDMVSSAEPGRA